MPVRRLDSEFQVDRFREEMKEAIAKGWTIKWEKVRAKRSLSQNAYYWALLEIFGIRTGYTPDELHVDLKRSYKLIYTKNGKKYLRSTTSLDTKEFTDYIDWIKNTAAEQGIDLPSADYLKQNWQEHQAWVDEHKQFIGQRENQA
jgi:hypothetical protein